MNIVFMGTPSFAVPSLERLVSDGHTFGTVVTAPDKPRGRGLKVVPTEVAQAALRLGLAIETPADLKDPAFAEHLRSLSPDIVVVVAFRVLPESLFSIPSKGIFNLHASLLPKYRGAAPIARAIINGESQTGLTTFLLERSVDTGRILLQERIAIGTDETAGELHDRMSLLGAELVSRTVSLLGSGNAPTIEQDHSIASPAPKITREECRIDWSSAARDIHNRVRGFSPMPGAWTTIQGRVLKILRTRPVALTGSSSGVPGGIASVTAKQCIVRCGDGGLELLEVMLEGRSRMNIEEFLRGTSLGVDLVLGGDAERR